jgi:hypothetical protein
MGGRGLDHLIELVEDELTVVQNVYVSEDVFLVRFDVAFAVDQKVGRTIHAARGRQKSA